MNCPLCRHRIDFDPGSAYGVYCHTVLGEAGRTEDVKVRFAYHVSCVRAVLRQEFTRATASLTLKEIFEQDLAEVDRAH